MKEVTKHHVQVGGKFSQKVRWNDIQSRSLVVVKKTEDSADLMVRDYRERHWMSKWQVGGFRSIGIVHI